MNINFTDSGGITSVGALTGLNVIDAPLTNFALSLPWPNAISALDEVVWQCVGLDKDTPLTPLAQATVITSPDAVELVGQSPPLNCVYVIQITLRHRNGFVLNKYRSQPLGIMTK